MLTCAHRGRSDLTVFLWGTGELGLTGSVLPTTPGPHGVRAMAGGGKPGVYAAIHLRRRQSGDRCPGSALAVQLRLQPERSGHEGDQRQCRGGGGRPGQRV